LVAVRGLKENLTYWLIDWFNSNNITSTTYCTRITTYHFLWR